MEDEMNERKGIDMHYTGEYHLKRCLICGEDSQMGGVEFWIPGTVEPDWQYTDYICNGCLKAGNQGAIYQRLMGIVEHVRQYAEFLERKATNWQKVEYWPTPEEVELFRISSIALEEELRFNPEP